MLILTASPLGIGRCKYEVDRDLTLEEQVDEIVLMLAEGKIGIHQFAALHGKAWTAVLHSRGQEDPAVLRQRAES